MSRLNALQHGLTAATPVLPGEDPAERATLFERLRDDLAPVGGFEEELVEQIASTIWRLRRVERVETALYFYRLLEDCREDGIKRTAGIPPAMTRVDGLHYLSPDAREEGQAVSVMSRAFIEAESVSLGRAFLRDVADGYAFGQLARYETNALRNLQRLARELSVRQAKRGV